MILRPSPVSTDRFTYVREENMLVAEASDLPSFGQVYDDACDEGLTLVSHKTGNEHVFGVEHVEMRDGDLLYWDLRPADRAMRDVISVRVFND